MTEQLSGYRVAYLRRLRNAGCTVEEMADRVGLDPVAARDALARSDASRSRRLDTISLHGKTALSPDATAMFGDDWTPAVRRSSEQLLQALRARGYAK